MTGKVECLKFAKIASLKHQGAWDIVAVLVEALGAVEGSGTEEEVVLEDVVALVEDMGDEEGDMVAVAEEVLVEVSAGVEAMVVEAAKLMRLRTTITTLRLLHPTNSRITPRRVESGVKSSMFAM